MLYSIFDGTENVLVNDISSVTDDEEVTESLVEDDFGDYAAVGAAQHHGKGVLAFTQSFTVFCVGVFGIKVSRYEAFVACFEGLECVFSFFHF